MIDRASGFVDGAERKARERTALSAAEVFALALTAAFAAVGGGSLLLMLAII